MSLSIAITTEDHKHIGFLLLAPDESVHGGVETGDCIFRSLPADAEDFEHPLAERLYGYQQIGEFRYQRLFSAESTKLTVAIEDGFQIQIEMDVSGQGSISEQRQDLATTKIGIALASVEDKERPSSLIKPSNISSP